MNIEWKFDSKIQLSLNYKSNSKQTFKQNHLFSHFQNHPIIHSNHNNRQQQQKKMSDNEYNEDFQNEQGRESQQYFVKQRLRRQAYNRKTEYVHPRVNFFDHEPINSKESQQLRKQLISLYKPKVEVVRGQYDIEDVTKDYDKCYEEFIKMTLKKEVQQRQLTESIGEMHEMADILLGKPDLTKDALYLYSKAEPSQMQEEEIRRIFDRYELAYKEGEQVEENLAEDTIKRAKQFLRDKYS